MVPDYERIRKLTTKIVLRLLFTVFEGLSDYEILRKFGAEGRNQHLNKINSLPSWSKLDPHRYPHKTITSLT